MMKNKTTLMLDINKASIRRYLMDKVLLIDFTEEDSISIVPNSYPVNLEGCWSLYEGKPRLQAHIIAMLKLICQNSLEEFDYQIKQDIDLLFVDEIRYFSSRDLKEDFYMCNGHLLDLHEVIREEIILTLPIYPKSHPLKM